MAISNTTPTSGTPPSDGSVPYFNLVDEPWITALGIDGFSTELSLTDVFRNAESIRELEGELPTMRPVLLRLLIAIMSRALGLPKDADDWYEKTMDWDSAAEKIHDYLREHHDRFWLKHPTEPFYQVADLAPMSGEAKELGTIVADFPANVRFFTQRGPKSLERMRPGEAARWLVHTHAYDTSGIKTPDRRDSRAKGGKVYPLGTAWAGKGEILVATGQDLAGTLCLNFVAPAMIDVVSGAADLPPWERPQPGPVEEFDAPAIPAGFLQVYTWQARRLQLVFDDGEVTGVVLCYGDPLAEQNRNELDPMMVWRYSRPQSKSLGSTVYMPGLVDPSKAVWRSFAAWLPTAAQGTVDGQARFLEPGVLRWIGELNRDNKLPLGFRPNVALYGVQYGSNNTTYADVVDESMTVPSFLLEEEATDAAETVLRALDYADTTAWYLGTFAANLAKARGIESAESYREEAKEQSYLRSGAAFRSWLDELAKDTEWIRARRDWQQRLRADALGVAKELLDDAGPATYVGRVVDSENGTWLNAQIALAYLHRGLKKTLPLAYEEQTV